MPGKEPKVRIHYFIPVGKGEACEVGRDVYLCWYESERRERYQKERDRRNGLCHSGKPLAADLGGGLSPCADVYLPAGASLEDLYMWRELVERLYHAIGCLQEHDRELIDRIYFDGVSMRCYAREIGATHTAVRRRREKILKDMRIMIDFE